MVEDANIVLQRGMLLSSDLFMANVPLDLLVRLFKNNLKASEFSKAY